MEGRPDKRSYQVDFSLYGELAPNHLPQIDLARSIRELQVGLAKIVFPDTGFRQSQYVRLRTLTRLREGGLLDDQLSWTGRSHGIEDPGDASNSLVEERDERRTG